MNERDSERERGQINYRDNLEVLGDLAVLAALQPKTTVPDLLRKFVKEGIARAREETPEVAEALDKARLARQALRRTEE